MDVVWYAMTQSELDEVKERIAAGKVADE